MEEERNNTDGFKPEYFEMSFGQFKNQKDDEVNEMLIGEVKVRGKIDRVDVKSDENTNKVIDYKLSGKRPAKKDLENGLSLQLPLYLYASKKMIEAELEKSLILLPQLSIH